MGSSPGMVELGRANWSGRPISGEDVGLSPKPLGEGRPRTEPVALTQGPHPHPTLAGGERPKGPEPIPTPHRQVLPLRCPYCRSFVPRDANVCPYCGSSLLGAAPSPLVSPGMAATFYVLAIFFPIVGIVVGAIFLTNPNPGNRELGRNLLIVAVLSMVFGFLLWLPLACAMGYLGPD